MISIIQFFLSQIAIISRFRFNNSLLCSQIPILPLDPGIRSDLRVRHKVIQHPHPRIVMRQSVIIILCYFTNLKYIQNPQNTTQTIHFKHLHLQYDTTYFGQITSRDGREVMMFIMISHIESDTVQDPIIRIRFISLPEHVMFRDEVSCDGMSTQSQ
jgi:hypothetical protein